MHPEARSHAAAEWVQMVWHIQKCEHLHLYCMHRGTTYFICTVVLPRAFGLCMGRVTKCCWNLGQIKPKLDFPLLPTLRNNLPPFKENCSHVIHLVNTGGGKHPLCLNIEKRARLVFLGALGTVSHLLGFIELYMFNIYTRKSEDPEKLKVMGLGYAAGWKSNKVKLEQSSDIDKRVYWWPEDMWLQNMHFWFEKVSSMSCAILVYRFGIKARHLLLSIWNCPFVDQHNSAHFSVILR